MIRIRTPSAVQHPSATQNHHTYFELHLRLTARLIWLLHHMKAIAAAAAAARAAAAASSGSSKEQKRQRQQQRQQRQQQQQQQLHNGGGGDSSNRNGSSDGVSISPAILLPYLPNHDRSRRPLASLSSDDANKKTNRHYI